MKVIETLRLFTATSACEIAPSLGGAILRLLVAGTDVLRPAPEVTANIQNVACFAMLPFANRVAHGRFTFQGRDVVIGVDPDGDPHALHGHGWRRPWTLLEQHDNRATLAFRHDGQGWPWPYYAEQRIFLTPAGLRFDVVIENLDDSEDMPIGIGLHPFFARTRQSRIAGVATSCWRNDDSGLAIEEVIDNRLSSPSGCTVDSLEGTDTFFSIKGGVVMINSNICLSSDAAAGFQIYVPVGRDFFCVEPVTHAPNSFGRAHFKRVDVIPRKGRKVWTFSISIGLEDC